MYRYVKRFNCILLFWDVTKRLRILLFSRCPSWARGLCLSCIADTLVGNRHLNSTGWIIGLQTQLFRPVLRTSSFWYRCERSLQLWAHYLYIIKRMLLPYRPISLDCSVVSMSFSPSLTDTAVKWCKGLLTVEMGIEPNFNRIKTVDQSRTRTLQLLGFLKVQQICRLT